MPSRKRTSKRRSRSKKTSRSPYRYNRKNNLLKRVSKRKTSKRSNKRSKRQTKSSKRRRVRASSAPRSRRRLQIRVSPRKLVDISAFTRNSPYRSKSRDGFQKVQNRKSAKKYRLTVGGSPRKSRVHSITSRIRKMTSSPRHRK